MRTVLICDDEPVIRMSLKNMLKAVGFDEIMECGDGETAVAMAISRLPDIAILDIAMPKMDGITATREIRKKLKIPIIFLTAAYDAETVQKAKEARSVQGIVKSRLGDGATIEGKLYLEPNKIRQEFMNGSMVFRAGCWAGSR